MSTIQEQLQAIPEGALDDLVHDLKSGEATDINNSGVEGQLKYLRAFYADEQILKIASEGV